VLPLGSQKCKTLHSNLIFKKYFIFDLGITLLALNILINKYLIPSDFARITSVLPEHFREIREIRRNREIRYLPARSSPLLMSLSGHDQDLKKKNLKKRNVFFTSFVCRHLIIQTDPLK